MLRHVLFIAACLLWAGTALAADVRPAPVDTPAECACTECGMTVTKQNTKFLSEIIVKGGRPGFFCDLGDMMVYYEVLKNKKTIQAIYVKDYASGAWLDGRAAYYLAGTNVATPMRYGILAFKDRAGAERFKKEKGGDRVYTFDEIIAAEVYRR